MLVVSEHIHSLSSGSPSALKYTVKNKRGKKVERVSAQENVAMETDGTCLMFVD